MNTTSLSLLDRLKHAKPDAAKWHKLHDIYLPLIRHWLSCLPGLRDESEDLTQEILIVLFRKLPGFERKRHGSFRAWLRQITVNRMLTFCKTRRKQPRAGGDSTIEQLLTQLAGNSPSSGNATTINTFLTNCSRWFSRTLRWPPGRHSLVSL
jgi:RNA polymerase sigma factor (sigma-70 family)